MSDSANESSYQMQLASRWASSANRRREALKAAHEQDVVALIELMTTYLRLKSARRDSLSQQTLALYAESVRRFLDYAGPPEAPRLSLLQLEGDEIDLWLYYLQKQENLQLSSARRHLYGLRNLLRALVWAKVLKSDPSADVRPPSDITPAHTRKRALSARQLSSLLALPAQLHPKHPTRAARDRTFLLLGGRLGLRAAELVGLNIADIDQVSSSLRVVGKGNKLRYIPLTAQVLQELRHWLQYRQSEISEALFISLAPRNKGGRLTTKGGRDIVTRYYQEIGLSPEMWGLHTLRRTAGTQLYKATRDLHVVADILGHSAIASTAIYAKMDDEVRLEALEKVEFDG